MIDVQPTSCDVIDDGTVLTELSVSRLVAYGSIYLRFSAAHSKHLSVRTALPPGPLQHEPEVDDNEGFSRKLRDKKTDFYIHL